MPRTNPKKRGVKARSPYIQRPGGINSRYHTDNYVPTPGSASLPELRRRSRDRKRAAR